MRSVFASCLLFTAFAIASIALDAPVAHADEIFELENGVVLRGYVMRESEDEVTIRLTGFARTNTVTVGKDRIKKRYATSAPTSSTEPIAPKPFTPSTPNDVTISTSYRPPDLHEDDTGTLPEDEPEIEDESFMARFLRLARVAIPESLHAQVTIGLLLAIVLLVLISGGARLADVDDTPFFGTVVLAVLLGGSWWSICCSTTSSCARIAPCGCCRARPWPGSAPRGSCTAGASAAACSSSPSPSSA